FIEFVEQLERDEEIQLETFELGKDKVVIVTIAPDAAKQDRDISIPVLSPILTRKKSLAEEISELDVGQFSCPVLPRKQDDAAARISGTKATTSSPWKSELSGTTRSRNRKRPKK